MDIEAREFVLWMDLICCRCSDLMAVFEADNNGMSKVECRVCLLLQRIPMEPLSRGSGWGRYH